MKVIGLPEAKEREKRVNKIFAEITAENVPNLEEGKHICKYRNHRLPNKETHTKMHHN